MDRGHHPRARRDAVPRGERAAFAALERSNRRRPRRALVPRDDVRGEARWSVRRVGRGAAASVRPRGGFRRRRVRRRDRGASARKNKRRRRFRDSEQARLPREKGRSLSLRAGVRVRERRLARRDDEAPREPPDEALRVRVGRSVARVSRCGQKRVVERRRRDDPAIPPRRSGRGDDARRRGERGGGEVRGERAGDVRVRTPSRRSRRSRRFRFRF